MRHLFMKALSFSLSLSALSADLPSREVQGSQCRGHVDTVRSQELGEHSHFVSDFEGCCLFFCSSRSFLKFCRLGSLFSFFLFVF